MSTFLNTISSHVLNSTIAALLFDALFKSVVVLAAAAGLCWLLRRGSAAARHWVWFLALASLPCLLVFTMLPRPWEKPLWSVSADINSLNQVSVAFRLAPDARPGQRVAPAAAANSAAQAEGSHVRSSHPFVVRFGKDWLVLAVAVWCGGAAVGLVSLLVGQVQLVRLAGKARPLQDPAWRSLLGEACSRLRLHRPVRLLHSVGNTMPLAWGWLRPAVLLPAEAGQWETERRKMVLLHEVAHLKRWDCLTQTVACVVCALYWPNPLVWLAAHRMCAEREQACDDLVLNSGWRASDYATQLVDIARSFRRAPQLAGIAMARSTRLQDRVAAILDASRARGLRPFTAAVLLVLMAGLLLSVGWGCSEARGGGAEQSALHQQQIAQVEAFARAKEKQSEALAAQAGEEMAPEIRRFFKAATSGDWRTVTNLYMFCRQQAPAPTSGSNAPSKYCLTAYWQPLLELDLAYCQVAECEPKYTALLADGIINSIPAGSIYFGGTDPGRGVPTAFCKSHVDADPFFTLTQNALADDNYLTYLRSMYGGKIYTPTIEDSRKCFQEYASDAERRLQEHKLRPGEDVKMVNGKPEVSGQIAVMAINGLLTKVIFDRNPDRQFYLEESFPLDWMYPYLEPHGLIMKINRQPLAELPDDVLARDHEYWSKIVGEMLGNWLNDQTSVREVADFVDRVYVRKNLKGFTGDPSYIQNDYATKMFSKLRSSVGGLYAWRLSMSPEYRPKTQVEEQRLREQADFAFRQAFAMCPASPEAVFRYAQFLLQAKRLDDALLVAETACKVDPANQQVKGLISSLEAYRSQTSSGH